jgi:hypothetical protein
MCVMATTHEVKLKVLFQAFLELLYSTLHEDCLPRTETCSEITNSIKECSVYYMTVLQ